MVAAERDQLLANRAVGVLALLTEFRVLNNFLHLVASYFAAIGVTTLTSVDERLDASLDGLVPGVRGVRALVDLDQRVDLLQLVLVVVVLVALVAQVEVVAGAAVPAGVPAARVARVVHVLVLLSVQSMAEAESGVLGPPQRTELPVLLSRSGQEGVSSVHEIAGHQRIRVLDLLGDAHLGLLRVQPDREEHLLVLLQHVVQLVGHFVAAAGALLLLAGGGGLLRALGLLVGLSFGDRPLGSRVVQSVHFVRVVQDVFALLALGFLFVRLANAVFDDVRPEVALEVGQSHRTAQVVVLRLLVDVLVLADNPVGNPLVQHLLVPILQTLRLRYLLLRRMAVEDVVVAFGRGTGPDVRHGVAQIPHVLQVRQQDLVVHVGPQFSGLEEVDGVQVRDVHSSRVRLLALAAVLLHVQPEEADLDAVHHLEGEHGLRSVGELVGESLGTVLVLHQRLHFHLLVGAAQHSDDYLVLVLGVSALLPDVVVHPGLDVSRQLAVRQL